MSRHSRLMVGCCGAAFALAAFFVGLEVSATTAAPSVDRAATAVNRTLKGDRLPLIPAWSRNAVNGPLELKAPPAAKPELPEGCEPMISSIGRSPLAQIPGRCLS
jgi:hypothetical protein